MTERAKTKGDLEREVLTLRHRVAELEATLASSNPNPRAEREPGSTPDRTQYVLEQMLNRLPICITQLSQEGEVLLSLGEGLTRWGLAANQLVGLNLFESYPPYRDLMAPGLEGRTSTFITDGVFEDGSAWAYQNYVIPDLSNPDGGCINISLDITERFLAERRQRALEAQVQESQRVESLGIMAGGIAHDFNNLLTGIIGSTELAQLDTPPNSPALTHLRNVYKASNRAAELCRQMLAYAGKGRFWSMSLDLSNMFQEIRHMLDDTVPVQVQMDWHFGETPPIYADPTQIRQVLGNLITNSAEAIGSGEGTITISLDQVTVGPKGLVVPGMAEPLAPGHYTRMEVSDTGCGIEREIIDKIFDPFFSTKMTGRGLGLAAVKGILRTHKARLSLQSQVGIGTTVQIYFPTAAAAKDALPSEEPAPMRKASAANKILLVDGEMQVRRVGRHMISAMGFEVLTAGNAAEALTVAGQIAHELCLVIVDYALPGTNAEEVLTKFRLLRRDLPILLSGNYLEANLGQLIRIKLANGFLQKPIRLQPLREAIEGILNPSSSLTY